MSIQKGVHPVILAGGLGKRLWPLSRSDNPKQYVEIFDGNSLFQNTLEKLRNLGFLEVSVVCDAANLKLAKKQVEACDINCEFIVEPVGRNTAPALALFSLNSKKRDKTLFILPSDHMIDFDNDFLKTLNLAKSHSDKGAIVLFGIKTRIPSVSYGYIKRGADLKDAFLVESFLEKPDLKLAKDLHLSEDFYWNSGMLVTNAKTYLEELKEHDAELFIAVEGSIKSQSEIDKDRYSQCKNISVDFSVLEKTKNTVLIPIDKDWDDLGSWNSISANSETDSSGNTLIGDIISIDNKNSYIRSDSRLVGSIGLENMIIVDTEDSLFISHKNRADEIKDLLVQIENKFPEKLNSKDVRKPWGSYKSLICSEGYQVKILNIESGHQLSLQRHKHRSEHWTVVTGEAEIIKGDKTLHLEVNESVYFDKGEIHSVKNSGNSLLRIIEVQVGDYLGEDDIERLEDIYDRT